MANSTPSRPGFKTGGAANNLDLYLELFGGEVLNQYQTATIMRDKHRLFNLSGGKSLKMPFLGQATAAYHTPGTELVGGQIAGDEIVLTPDDKLIADIFMADIDEKLSHFDARSAYAEELGQALARQSDGTAIRAALKAARDAGKLGQGGGSVLEAAANTDPSALFETFRKAVQVMDLKNVNVDNQDIYGLVSTLNWYALQGTEKMRNRDYNPEANIKTKSPTLWIDGVQVFKSNIASSFFGTNDTTHPMAYYRGNATNTVGLVWTKNAIATAEVQSVFMDTEEQKRKQGTLLIAGYMSGTRVYRATDAVEIKTA